MEDTTIITVLTDLVSSLGTDNSVSLCSQTKSRLLDAKRYTVRRCTNAFGL